ncbi:MAG TPA: hypothetical protein VFU22_29715 [Roseiflexaceae bacterium]|nr:hypothetical protein [Roseiflexaceae bacterium]
MSEQRETYRTGDDLPPELMQSLIVLWRIERPIVVSIKPRDAWVALGIIQFATRNPALSVTQRQLIEAFGRQLQQALVVIDSTLGTYLEMGWDPAYDQPKELPE